MWILYKQCRYKAQIVSNRPAESQVASNANWAAFAGVYKL